MTSPQHDPASSHDLSPEDLRLTAAKPPHHRHTIETDDNAAAPSLLIAPSSKRKKKSHRVRNALLIVTLSLLCIALIAVGTVHILSSSGRSALLAQGPSPMTAPEELLQNNTVEITDDGHTVTYNGVKYAFNDNRTNILCIGVDKRDLGLENDVVGTGGQADSIAVLSIETKTGAVDILAVSRDAITPVDIYSESGLFYDTQDTQLCLSFAYGDGYHTSCENTVKSVSRLLYGVPINTYFAIDLGCIATLNDAVGGVPVQLLTDFTRVTGTTCYAGETITLYGSEAERYVRDRDIEKLDSNNARMQRQEQYVTAFFNKAIAATKDSLKTPLTLYDAVADECTTNLSASKITFLATTLVQHDSTLNVSRVPGNVVLAEDDGFAEFIVDDAALYEQVLNIFYTKVSE